MKRAISAAIGLLLVLAVPAMAVTIDGTGQSEQFVGTGGPDTINGGGGTDDIGGRGGDDVIRGNSGDDYFLRGERGNDRVYGDAGADVVMGGAGNDSLHSGSCPSVPDDPLFEDVYGGIGNDYIVMGNAGVDPDPCDSHAWGERGDDTIHAEGDPNSGPDHVDCGLGNDTAYVDPGDDVANCERVIVRR